MNTKLTRRDAIGAMAAATAGGLLLGRFADPAEAACCYFAAQDKDINQPGQKAFITWEPDRERESFTVQPKFEGNAVDFGMVIPTPAQPKLDEMPREFFKMMAIFTILEPMPLEKYKNFRALSRFGGSRGAIPEDATKSVVVLEEGVVGSLDYKIIRASDAKGLYDWLDENGYVYSGDEATLDFYIKKEWFFTVVKIDPKQMKRRDDGSFEGNVTPTRFTFHSQQLVYPLRITRISVKDHTEALFYVQAPEKMDLPEGFSYQYTWQSMWAQAMGFAVKRTDAEEAWLKHITPHLPDYAKMVERITNDGIVPTTLEWAKKIAQHDLDVIDGKEKYNRDAPAEDVKELKILRGHVKKDQVVTKMRKVFHPREMQDDLVMVRANAGGKNDDTAYYEILPTSPP